MHREVLRHAQQLLVERAEPVGGDGGDDGVTRGIRDPAVRRRRRAEGGLQGLVGLLQLARDGVDQRRRLGLRDDALLDELARELVAGRRMLGDLLRHQRLRVRGLVLLVVPVTAVAD